MLLSIDRVLQLLSSGKSLEKISEMADCDKEDVVDVIEKARSLLSKYEKNASKRKLIIKKKSAREKNNEDDDEVNIQREIFSGAELSVIPVQSPLIMYVSGISDEDSTNAGIGIVITDKDGKQVGKVSHRLVYKNEIDVQFDSIIKALKIADYFSVSELKIRTDMNKPVTIIENTGNQTIEHDADRLAMAKSLVSEIGNVRFELITTSQNDKAVFFARKTFEK